MKNNKAILNCVMSLVLIALTLFLGTTNNRKVKKVGNQLTEGKVNTVLIVLIIVLTLTEDLQIGFMLTLIYLVMLVRFNKKENFMSGPSPLKCETYGDSRKRTGTAFYPINP